MKALIFFIAFAMRVVSAIRLTAPVSGSTHNKGQDITIAWSSVGSDSTNFSLFVVNYNTHPTIALLLASNVSTSLGSITAAIPCSIRSDNGFEM